MVKFPTYRQLDKMDCGPTCLRMIARHYGKFYSQEFFREKSNITKGGVSLAGVAEAAEQIGMHSMGASFTFDTLVEEVTLPCIVFWQQRHFVVVYAIKRKSKWFARKSKPTDWIIRVADPAHGPIDYSLDDFMAGWTNKRNYQLATEEGVALLLEPGPDFEDHNTGEAKDAGERSLQFLWAYFTPYKRLIGQLAIGLAVGSLIQLIFPFLMQSIVDYGVNYRDLNFIYLVLIAQLVLFASASAVQIFRGWLLLHITSRISIKLLANFLAKLMRLSIGFFDSKNTGDILQRIQDNRRIEQFLSTTTLSTLFSLFNLVVFGFILAYYSWNVFFVFGILALMQIGWTLLFLRKRKELDYRYFDQSAGNQSTTIQLINGMQEIKLNNSDKRRRWEWEAIQVRLFRISVKGLALTQTQNTGGSLLNELKNIIITFISAKAVIDGQMSLGVMLAIQYIIGQLNGPINSFITFVQAGQDAKLSLDRLNEVYRKTEEEPADREFLRELPIDKTIRIRNLSFRYGEQASPLVLNDLNFDIPEGQVTAIVGASGSGKTTLIKLLLQFYEPSGGSIAVGQSNLKHFSPRFWRSVCGTVMQDGFIFSDTIIRNITESDPDGRVDQAKVVYASRVAQLTEFVERLPLGYSTRIGAEGMGISGGQSQRLLIARAVYKSPDYLFLDEATSALDANNERAIMEEMQQFYDQRTVVVVAHRLSTVRQADHIIVLDQGRVVELGNHKTLVAKKGYYYKLVKNQLELGN